MWLLLYVFVCYFVKSNYTNVDPKRTNVAALTLQDNLVFFTWTEMFTLERVHLVKPGNVHKKLHKVSPFFLLPLQECGSKLHHILLEQIDYGGCGWIRLRFDSDLWSAAIASWDSLCKVGTNAGDTLHNSCAQLGERNDSTAS